MVPLAHHWRFDLEQVSCMAGVPNGGGHATESMVGRTACVLLPSLHIPPRSKAAYANHSFRTGLQQMPQHGRHH